MAAKCSIIVQYEVAVLMGHGSRNPSLTAYGHLQMLLQDAGIPAYVGTIEAYALLSDLIRRLRSASVKRIGLQPLLLAAGDHAKDAIADWDGV